MRGTGGKNFVENDKTWVILFVCTTCKFINWQKEEIYDEKTGRGEKSHIIYRHASFFLFFMSGHQLLFLFEIKMFIFVKILEEHYIKFTRMKLWRRIAPFDR